MFSHRQFMHQPVFDAHLAEIQAESPVGARFFGFNRFVHDALGWFEAQPSLSSVKLVCAVKPELEGTPPSVRIRHHVKLVGPGGQVPQADDYALEALPWRRMGNGAVELRREDPLVQRYLRNDENDELSYEQLVQALSLQLDQAFDEIEVIHDLGLRSAG